jgi:hypothetical protein
MKNLKKATILLVFFSVFVSFTSPTIYGQSAESSELIIYRPEQGAMSGASGIEMKVFINDQEVGVVLNGTVLNYTVYSQGALKIKFIAVGMGTTVGSPTIINLEAKHGEITPIQVSYKFPKGAEAKILNAKEQEKVKKLNWADTMNGKENIEKPFIEK